MLNIEICEVKTSSCVEVEKIYSRVTSELREIYVPNSSTKKVGSGLKCVQVFAQCGNHIAGAVQYIQSSDKIHLQGLATDPGFRNIGIGTSLIEYVKKIASDKKVDCIEIETIEETGNETFFFHLGFESVSRTRSKHFVGTRGEPVHILLMRLRVNVC